MKTFAKSLLAVALAVGAVVSAHATWTSEISGTTGYISDGNWKIQLKRAGSRTGSDGKAYFVWNIGDGSNCAIAEGSGELDLTGVKADTGLTLVQLAINSCRQYAGLTSIILPDTLEKIGNTTFYACPNLVSITPWLPGSVTSVGNQAFEKCTKFVPGEHLIITNDAFTAIGGSAFIGLAIKSVSFTSNLVSIGSSAFANCPITRISPMEFPKLKKVEGWNFNSGAIEGDTLKFTSPELTQLGSAGWSFTIVNVTNIVVSPTITTWMAFYKGPNLESITCMPMKRKLVPTETAITFKGFGGGCPKLTRVDLPFRKRFAIPDSAFAGATQLQDVYFWGAAPTSLGKWYNPRGNYVLRFHCAKQQDEEGWLAIADELTDEDRARETYPGPHCFGKTKYEANKNISWLVWDRSPYDPLGLMLLLR